MPTPLRVEVNVKLSSLPSFCFCTCHQHLDHGQHRLPKLCRQNLIHSSLFASWKTPCPVAPEAWKMISTPFLVHCSELKLSLWQDQQMKPHIFVSTVISLPNSFRKDQPHLFFKTSLETVNYDPSSPPTKTDFVRFCFVCSKATPAK